MKLHVSLVAALFVSFAAFGVATAPDASLSFRLFGCTDCDDDCGFGDHESTSDLNGDWELDVGSHANTHGCSSGACGDYHATGCQFSAQVDLGWTGLDRVAIAEITDAVEGASSEDLPAIVQTYRSALEFNAERGTLQVIGCSGAIMANLPLSAADISVLAE